MIVPAVPRKTVSAKGKPAKKSDGASAPSFADELKGKA